MIQTSYDCNRVKDSVVVGRSSTLKMLQLAPLNRVPFGKFNRASAFPVACCGVSERTTIICKYLQTQTGPSEEIKPWSK
jgi:hypothetical protein